MKERPMLLMAWVCVLGVATRLKGEWFWLAAFFGLLAGVIIFRKMGINYIAGGVILLAMFFIFYGRTWVVENNYARTMEVVNTEDEFLIMGKVEAVSKKKRTYQVTLVDCQLVQEGRILSCPNILCQWEGKCISIGEKIEIKGKVSLFDEARNEGNFDYRRYYRSQGIIFRVENPIILDRDGKVSRLKEGLYQLRIRLGEILDQAFSKEDAGVMRAMLLGDKAELDSDIKKLYQKNGIAHVLAISGLHITLLGFYLFLLLKRIAMPLWINVPITFFFLYCYGYLVGNGISVTRAVIMLVIIILGRVLKQAEDMLTSLSIFAIGVLWANPFIIMNGGFLFSCTAIMGIAATGKIMVKYLRKVYGGGLNNPWKRRGFSAIFKMVSSFAIFLTTLPLVAQNYYELPIYGMLVNILILPFMTIVVGGSAIGVLLEFLPLSATHLICGILWRMTGLVLDYYQMICLQTSRLPGASWIVGRMSSGRLILYLTILLGWLILLKRAAKRGQRIPLINILCVALLLFIGFHRIPRSSEMDMLDVGQGLGIYFHAENTDCFFDGGSTDVYKVGSYRILPFLKSKGVKKIDYWFVSHLDTDHCSGLLELLEEGYLIDTIVLSSYLEENDNYLKLKELAEVNNTKLLYMKAGNGIQISGLAISCLWPNEKCVDANDGSLVISVNDEDNWSALLLGDISKSVEERLVMTGKVSPVDYIQSAHHGSNNSNSLALLAIQKGKTSLISCGINNSYGHPGTAAIERMDSCHMNVYYTMKQGQLSISKNGINPFLEKEIR